MLHENSAIYLGRDVTRYVVVVIIIILIIIIE